MNFEKKDTGRIIMIIISAAIYSFGMNSFVRYGNLFPGGYAGISRLASLLLERELHLKISFSVIYFTMNIITTMFVWRHIGHKFIVFSVLWFSISSFLTSVIDVPVMTDDPLLISVFGGVINGLAVGLALRYNASSGGTDFIAVDLAGRLNMPTWNYMFLLNACVLTAAGLAFGWTQALYSMIFQYVSKEVVSTLHERYKLKRLQIVTDYPDEISEAIFRICRHGITKLKCTGEYSHRDHYLLMITVNGFQKNEVIAAAQSVDPKAFITVNSVEKIIGNYYQKPLD